MSQSNTVGRVIEALRAEVAGLPAGDRLPSVRELMARHRVGPATVQRAVAQLAAEGLLEPRPGRGTFVAQLPAGSVEAPELSWQEIALGGRTTDTSGLAELLSLPRPGVVALSTGYPDHSLQATGPLGAALARAGRRTGAWDRHPFEGSHDLRAFFAREAGGGFTADDVVICPGGQAALAIALRALTAPGDAILVESPTYLGLLALARETGLRIIPVPSDQDGVRPELLEHALAATRARVIALQPTFANPTGAVLAPERRATVLEAAHAAGAFIIEDDWARDLALEGAAPPPLAAADLHGHVIYVRSLTKAAAPMLRVAAAAARGAARARLRTARLAHDLFVSAPLQETALELVSSAAWRTHRRRLAATLRHRRDALIEATEQLPRSRITLQPRGGLHLWLALDSGIDDLALASQALAAGVHVMPGRPWYAADPPAPHLRLTFAGAPVKHLQEGVARLTTVLQ